MKVMLQKDLFCVKCVVDERLTWICSGISLGFCLEWITVGTNQ